jgi:spoIIIJ-associated protein
MDDQLLESAKRRLDELVSFMGINVDSEVKETEDGISLEINSEHDTARLIGHHGETLHAIEYLVGQMIKNESEAAPRVMVDVAGYREARRASLEEKAQELARRVIETGREELMRPMNPAERRIVHMALQDMDGITTESRGEGRGRRLAIIPA